MGAPGHRRVAVFAGKAGQDNPQIAQVADNDGKRGADLQHVRRVHDVLGGGAPVHIASGIAGSGSQLMHQRQDRVADDLGLVPQLVIVDDDRARRGIDGRGRFLRHHAAAGLGPGQRRFHLEVTPDQGFIAEHRAHLGRAEHVAEQDGIEHRAAHGSLPIDIMYVHRLLYEHNQRVNILA